MSASSVGYLTRSLRYYWPLHAATALGVLVAAAVITGALVVGDSVRGSLRRLATGGLERIDALMTANIPFRAALADEWSAACQTAVPRARLVGCIASRGAATARRGDEVRRIAGMALWGVPAEFAALAARRGDAAPAWPALGADEAAITDNVARELGVAVGDWIVVTLPVAADVPADSTLGEKEETAASRRLRLVQVLSAEAEAPFARLSRQPNQRAPRNVFLALATLQELMQLPGRLNAIAVGRGAADAAGPLSAADIAALQQRLRPTLADYQLRLHVVQPAAPEAAPLLQLDSGRLLLPAALVDAARRLWGDRPGGVQGSAVYLANRLAHGERRVPYSTVAGLGPNAAAGLPLEAHGAAWRLADDEVVLNDWAAEQLAAEVGDTIEVTYYEPETTHGALREAPPVRLQVRGVVPLRDAEGRPTRAVDPELAPELPGVTDQQTINDWELPFELVEPIRDVDEDYWDDYRTTPKAFVSLELAERLWRTRWGSLTALRLELPPGSDDAEAAAARLSAELAAALAPEDFGLTLDPLRSAALASARGTTPFEALFLGFSFFLLAAAVMLVALLNQLSVQRRAPEAGLLLATGAAPQRVRRLFAAEGLLVALVGSVLGALAGWGYARLMLYGLNTWWVEATSVPFLQPELRLASLLWGGLAGLAVSYAAIVVTLRRLGKLSVRELLAGDVEPRPPASAAGRRLAALLPWALALGAVGSGVVAWRLQGEAQAGAFLGSGALTLGAALTALGRRLRPAQSPPPARWTLGRLALRTARRHPSRTLLAIGLSAAASFLLVGLGAFRQAPSEAGCGGFDLLATCDIPLQADLSTAAGRRQLGFGRAAEEALTGVTIVGCRLREGADASCLNLYQTQQPQILGVPAELGEQSRFLWASGSGADDPWTLLDAAPPPDAEGRPVAPMAVDRNTALYSLKLYRPGDRLTIRDGRGQAAVLETAAMLQGSVLQGSLLVSEERFLELFPDSAGRRFFLIRTPAGEEARRRVQQTLESQLEDYGFDAIDARERLADLLAVQNTYLSTFQSLGALGLLLGAVGLGVAQVRSVLERRGELALLRAMGYSRRRLARLVLYENAALVAGGLALGCAAAAVATLPQAAANQTAAPWATLAALLAATSGVGLGVGALAVRAAVRVPLWAALRE